MFCLRPRNVRIDGEVLHGVVSVGVSRSASRSVVEHGDEGPHVVFADVPEQRVEVRIEREVAGSDVSGPGLGEQVLLEFETSIGLGDVGWQRVSVHGVVLSSEFKARHTEGGVAKIKMIGISSDGTSDPVAMDPVR